jgi:photosystem II stability/assembly factor-like uncharacterized protein
VFTRPAQRLAVPLIALCAGILLCALAAHANGAFPAVSQLVADLADGSHLVLRSNFGLLTTRDAGKNWDLVCEAGIGYQNIEPPVAVLGDGTTLVALNSGIAHGSDDECQFALGAGVTSYVADVARVPGTRTAAVAVSVDFDQNASQVWHTTDGGATWGTWGVALADLNAATLEVASSDASSLYVSGVSQSGTVRGVLARSADGGASWARFDVPGASKVSAPYIAAVAGGDPDTVYVRLSGTPGRLLVTHDGGQRFDDVLDFTGPFDGFALSPDGRYALASGRADGVWRAPTATLSFEQLSCAHLRCLSWTQAGLFACADEFQAGFLVGQSENEGLTFEARLHLSCVRGPLSCPDQSPVSQACSAAWPMISEQLGTDCAAASDFMPSTDCASSSGGSGMAGAAGAANGAGSGGSMNRPHGGCALGSMNADSHAWLLVIASLLWIAKRRRP